VYHFSKVLLNNHGEDKHGAARQASDQHNITVGTESQEPDTARAGQPNHTDDLLYAIEDVPPWYACILLGFQVTAPSKWHPVCLVPIKHTI